MLDSSSNSSSNYSHDIKLYSPRTQSTHSLTHCLLFAVISTPLHIFSNLPMAQTQPMLCLGSGHCGRQEKRQHYSTTLDYSSSLHLCTPLPHEDSACQCQHLIVRLPEHREYLIRWSHTSGGNDVKFDSRERPLMRLLMFVLHQYPNYRLQQTGQSEWMTSIIITIITR